MSTEDKEYWWRCEVRHYSIADEWGDHAYTSREVKFAPYLVIRHTPKGVWVKEFLGGERFILGTAKLQHAVPTKELAITDMIARKERHIDGCEARLASAVEDLRLLKSTKVFGRY